MSGQTPNRSYCTRAAGFDAVREAHSKFRAEPLVIVGAASDWPLLDATRGSVEQQLRALAGDARVNGLRLKYDEFGVQTSHAVVETSLADFLSCTERTCDGQCWYLQWRDLPHPTASMTTVPANVCAQAAVAATEASALPIHDAETLMHDAVRLPGLIRPEALVQVNAWIGRSRTSHLHFDGVDNLLVVADGRKEVILFSPWQLGNLYPQLQPDLRWQSEARSTLYLRDGETSFPKLRAAPRLVAVLEAGDALWIPAGWWHEVLTPSTTIAFNFWFEAHERSRLRPTLLHLSSELYAREYSQRVSETAFGDARAGDDVSIVAEGNLGSESGAGSADCEDVDCDAALANTITKASYWRRLLPELHCEELSGEGEDAKKPSPLPHRAGTSVAAEAAAIGRGSLEREGFAHMAHAAEPELAARLSRGIDVLWSSGWPPPFILVSDEAWQLAEKCLDATRALVGARDATQLECASENHGAHLLIPSAPLPLTHRDPCVAQARVRLLCLARVTWPQRLAATP